MPAQTVHKNDTMWASDAQRDRAIAMIGGGNTPSVALHRVQHARLESQRRTIAGVLLVASVVWLLVAAIAG